MGRARFGIENVGAPLPPGVFYLTSLNVGRTVFRDEIYGNDATGLVEDESKPFRTMSAALAASLTLTPTLTNRVLVRNKGELREDFNLENAVDIDLGNYYFSTNSSLAAQISDNGVDVDCIIYGNSIIDQNSGGITPTIQISGANSNIRINCDKINNNSWMCFEILSTAIVSIFCNQINSAQDCIFNVGGTVYVEINESSHAGLTNFINVLGDMIVRVNNFTCDDTAIQCAGGTLKVYCSKVASQLKIAVGAGGTFSFYFDEAICFGGVGFENNGGTFILNGRYMDTPDSCIIQTVDSSITKSYIQEVFAQNTVVKLSDGGSMLLWNGRYAAQNLFLNIDVIQYDGGSLIIHDCIGIPNVAGLAIIAAAPINLRCENYYASTNALDPNVTVLTGNFIQDVNL